jgi:hypothetical protein
VKTVNSTCHEECGLIYTRLSIANGTLTQLEAEPRPTVGDVQEYVPYINSYSFPILSFSIVAIKSMIFNFHFTRLLMCSAEGANGLVAMHTQWP